MMSITPIEYLNILVIEKAEEHQLQRKLMGHYPGATIHQASNLTEANALCKRVMHNLVIIDLDFADDDITALIRKLRSCAPQTTCVLACYIEEDMHIFHALKAGAKGYLLKDREPDQILKHLDNILAGLPTIAPEIAHHMLGYFHKQPNFDNAEQLSDRENEILALIANGHKRTQVAEQLNITSNTVASHLKAIYSKLNINSRAEATLEAVRRGLIKK
ncbi:MAG: response regulator transcription factor [Gammaproteobacteria bacterium]